jgi:hypothetical protein
MSIVQNDEGNFVAMGPKPLQTVIFVYKRDAFEPESGTIRRHAIIRPVVSL